MKIRKQLTFGLLGIIIINTVGNYFYKRFDLTEAAKQKQKKKIKFGADLTFSRKP